MRCKRLPMRLAVDQDDESPCRLLDDAQRGANRLAKAQLWRVQRPKGAGLSAGLGGEDKGERDVIMAGEMGMRPHEAPHCRWL
jgi:hypothetical protein